MRRTTIAALTLAGVVAITGASQILHHRTNSQRADDTTSTVTTVVKPLIRAQTTSPTGIAEPVDQPGPSAKTAVQAAVRFLKLDERLFPATTPTEARALSDSISSSSARTRLGDRAEAHQRETLAKGDLQGLTLRLAPISTRVRRLTTTSATVDVYLLRLWSFPTKGALDDYATAEIKLVWETGEWRLADSSVIDGPYPVARFSARPTLASTAARFEEILAGFTDTDLIP